MAGYGELGFNSDSAGGGALDYIQDAFQDISVPANSNAGFSSTVSKNPLGYYLGNPCTPRYGAKVLWIKDLVALPPEKSTVSSLSGAQRPTYQIVWHEDFPAAQGYMYGAPVLEKSPVDLNPTPAIVGVNGHQRTTVKMWRRGDGIGITGIIRRVQWLFEPSPQSSLSVQLQLDGANTSTINIGGSAVLNSSASSVTPWAGWDAQSSNEDREIHDFRAFCTADYQLATVVGAVVYYEITGGAIDCLGGSTYIDKSKVTPVGTSLALPSNTSFRGGRAAVYATPAAGFGVTTTFVTDIVSNATGSSGTNLLSLSPGTGASYPLGTLVFIPGATDYVGNVLSQSSDTLTMGVTLPIGLSNSVYQIARAGYSLGSTVYQLTSTMWEKAWDWDVTRDGITGFSSVISGSSYLYGVGVYQDPWQRFRVTGTTFQVLGLSGLITGQSNGIPLYNFGATNILTFPGSGSDIRVQGQFQALEFEWFAGLSGLIAGTMSIGGIPALGINENLSGGGFVTRRYLADSGPGFNSVRFASGSSHAGCGITRITAYKTKVPSGPSFGVLSELSLGQTFVARAAQNATLTAFGNIQRVYADQLALFGSWGREVGTGYAGGVRYAGGAVAETGRFSYYGTQFCIVGTQGTSFTLTVNGTPTVATFNQWQGGALSLGFQTLLFNAQAGISSAIEAIDFLTPDPVITNKQNFPQPIPVPSPEDFDVIGGKVYIRDKSIGPKQLQDGAVTQQKRASLGQQISVSSGAVQSNATTTPADVTGLTVTITTSGRPVYLQVIDDGSGNACSIAANSSTAEAIAQFSFLRGSTTLTTTLIQSEPAGVASVQYNLPATTLSHVDTPPAGTYTYKVQFVAGNATSTATITRCKLIAYEL